MKHIKYHGDLSQPLRKPIWTLVDIPMIRDAIKRKFSATVSEKSIISAWTEFCVTKTGRKESWLVAGFDLIEEFLCRTGYFVDDEMRTDIDQPQKPSGFVKLSLNGFVPIENETSDIGNKKLTLPKYIPRKKQSGRGRPQATGIFATREELVIAVKNNNQKPAELALKFKVSLPVILKIQST